MQYAAISLNLDSLGEAYGWPSGYPDPSFFQIADRFFQIARKYDFKYSIYVVGKDLEKPENRERVRAWARDGHEIGNHSWLHQMDLGAMSRAAIYEDVKHAHDAIAETTGSAPRGFISPAWNTSRTLYTVLSELGYEYDTSIFPSWIMFPVIAKNLYNHLGNKKFFAILKRKDWLTLAFGTRGVCQKQGVTVLPLPTNRFRVACWHTLGFMIGWKRHLQLLKSCLREIDAFYYLIHPADLMDRRDLDPGRKVPLERLGTPLEEKIHHLERAIENILQSGRKIITMSELARRHKII
ncbi:polysaccharide deacetylase family protein [Candidatus Uhrbacteria bacterium]|nr:polysaccharide deacetylase family protein [Candidatus Uhrbacteria bacterium]